MKMKSLNLIVAAVLLVAGFALTSCENNGPSPTPTPSGEKCKASDYKQVKIDGKIWMAENYRCSKYASNSEAYKSGIRTVTSTVPSDMYDAHFVDATNMDNWDKQSKQNASYLTKEQIGKLGYLYNWAAAVGVADGCTKEVFSGNRQGICPNGWHIPSTSEFYSLKKFIDNQYGSGFSVAGKYLKSTTGWKAGNGNDFYDFNALPSGRAFNGVAEYIATDAWFWTSTYFSVGSQSAKFYTLGSSDIFQDGTLTKTYAFSVRCVKD